MAIEIMLTWKEEPGLPYKLWTATLDGVSLDPTELERAFRPVWIEAGAMLAPFYLEKEWNAIYVELFEESGRVCIFPLKFRGDSIASAVCEIVIPSLKEFIRDSDAAEETPETLKILHDTTNDVAHGSRAPPIPNFAETFPALPSELMFVSPARKNR